MKTINLLIILLFTFTSLNAQIENALMKFSAVLELHSGEKIECKTKIPLTTKKKINYWLIDSDEKKQLPSNSIKSMQLTDKYGAVRNFHYIYTYMGSNNKKQAKNEKWLELVVEGKYNLYRMFMPGQEENDTWYVKIDKEETAFYMVSKSKTGQSTDFTVMKKFFNTYFNGYPEIIAKIDYDTYKDNRFINLIEQINAQQ